MKDFKKYSVFSLVVLSLMLQGCPKDEKDDKNQNDDTVAEVQDEVQIFSIEVTNLTSQQAFSPVAVILHNEGYHPYVLAEPASEALEHLAEGGANSALLESAESNGYVIDTKSGTASIAPGKSESIEVEGTGDEFKLSLVSMLVNTNDGFTGRDAMDISELSVNESKTFTTRVYDSGTELNDESSASLPGQGGEGFNAMRNDRDFVAIHSGIVSMDDGLASSALSASHRFDNPGARVVVTRIK